MIRPNQIKVDLRLHTPTYIQIVQQLQSLFLQGELHRGDQLPTVRQMAFELGINFNTVARAYRLLDKTGFISTQRGRGTFLLELSPSGEQQLRQDVLVELAVNSLEEATRLDFSLSEIARSFAAQVRLWQEKSIKVKDEQDDESNNEPA